VLYRHTSLGRYAIAIGGNEEAATLTGIRVDRALAALAGIVITGRLNAIQGDLGHRLRAAHLLATSPSPGSAAPATAASGVTTRRRSHIIATGVGMSQPFAGL
jgi:predicted ABC-type sugar transport system permease subunit